MPSTTPSTFTLQAKKIGPLRSLTGAWNDDRCVVYAPNGSGKTFVSRLLRLQQLAVAASAPGELGAPGGAAAALSAGLAQAQAFDASLSAALLTEGAREGSFALEVDQAGASQASTYRVELRRGEAPRVVSPGAQLIHVFNSDYVRDNLARQHYQPNGDIPGYIVGRSNIDLSQHQARLEEIRAEGSALRQRIEDALAAVRAELRSYGVRTIVREYKDITLDTLSQMELPESHEYGLALAALEDVGNVDPSAVRLAPASFEADGSFLARAQELLATPFTKATAADDFIARVNAQRVFYSTGVRLWKEGDGACPFCGSTPDADARALIESYVAYLDSEEARNKAELGELLERCDELLQSYRGWEAATLRCANTLVEVCGLLPSLTDVKVDDPAPADELARRLAVLHELLERKKSQLGEAIDGSEAVRAVQLCVDDARWISERYRELDIQVSHKLARFNEELLAARKALCTEALKRMRIELDGLLQARAAKQQEYVATRDELRRLSAQSRTPRRALVAEQLQELVERCLGDRYVFDPQSFGLSWRAAAFPTSADQVLSEGEQTVLALCHYLASLPTVVSHADEWDNLLLVVDDPVSGLDAAHAELVARCLSEVDELLGRMSGQACHARLLVLTHDEAWANTFARSCGGATRLHLDGTRLVPDAA